MDTVILCVAAFLLLTWVIYLKRQIVRLVSENEKLMAMLKVKIERESQGMQVGGASNVIGRRPPWMQ